MAEITLLTIGVDAVCTDGSCGEVSRIVVDTALQAVTHLVVEPKHRSGLGKLVPLDLVDVRADEVRLRCTVAKFDGLDPAEETSFLPGNNGGYGGYPPGQMVPTPSHFLGETLAIPGSVFDPGTAFAPVVSDAVPVGEVAIRRDVPVHATDGEIGRVHGFAIETGSHRIKDVLLQEGHLWGRKTVAIPIAAVTGVGDGIQLSITKQQVQHLSAV